MTYGQRKLALEIGRRLKHIRIALGVPIRELNVKATLSRGMLSQYENGKELPGTVALFRLAESLGTSVSHILHGLHQDGRLNPRSSWPAVIFSSTNVRKDPLQTVMAISQRGRNIVNKPKREKKK